MTSMSMSGQRDVRGTSSSVVFGLGARSCHCQKSGIVLDVHNSERISWVNSNTVSDHDFIMLLVRPERPGTVLERECCTADLNSDMDGGWDALCWVGCRTVVVGFM